MTARRSTLRKTRIAFPKLMRRIGVLPNLWDAELRAIEYSDRANKIAHQHDWLRRWREKEAVE